jgi:hypothetical protein
VRINTDRAFAGYSQWITSGGHWTEETLVPIIASMRSDSGHAKHDGRGRFRPSLIGDICDRKQVLSYHYESTDSAGNWYAWSGTLLHLGFQTFLLDLLGFDHLTIERPVAPKKGTTGITGKMDWRWDGEDIFLGMTQILGPHIGDYKTCSYAVYKIVIDKGPKPMHIEQLGYQMLTAGIHTAYLVYQERSHGPVASFLLELEPSDIQRMEDRLGHLQDAIEKDYLPPMLLECRSKSGAFKTCAFADICLQREVDDQRKRFLQVQGPPG